jgi:hypothetical protein
MRSLPLYTDPQHSHCHCQLHHPHQAAEVAGREAVRRSHTTHQQLNFVAQALHNLVLLRGSIILLSLHSGGLGVSAKGSRPGRLLPRLVRQ